MPGAEPIKIFDTRPTLHDRTSTTEISKHYFYQDVWAAKKIHQSGASRHVDIGSRVIYVGFLTTFTKVTFIDIRPLVVNLENLDCKEGNILSLPYANNSINSLSCLHVAEHIGLGRYGDPLDPGGTKKACKELSRVLAKNGNLYFALPVGKPRVEFNACRIHAPQTLLEYFSDLKLIEFSGIDDKGNFVQNIDISILKNAKNACGLFHFKK